MNRIGNGWGWKLGWAIMFVWALTMGSALAAPAFTAELEPDQVASGESAILKLTFTDLGDVPAPTLPAITNVTVTYRGAGRQFSIINFSQSSSVIHQYSLQTKAPGTVLIPPITVEVDGKKHSSRPLTLRVGPGLDLSKIGFLRITTPRTNVYVGETFPLEVRFYFQHPPEQQAPPSLNLEGFLKGRQQMDNLTPETINGAVHGVARWILAVTAIKPGEFDVGPAELQTAYRVGARRGIFGNYEQRQLNFTSDPIKIRVQSPPTAGRPATFDGAVGRFRMEVAAAPTNVAAGDPVTVRVKVTGTGNFDGLRLPDLPANSGFQAYPGTNSFAADDGDPLGITGTKNFEMVLVPEQPGLQRLKWPVLSFWDPKERRYATEEPRPLMIQVRPGAATQAQPSGGNAVASGAAAPPTSTPSVGDLALKYEMGALLPLTSPMVTRAWYWSLWALPLATYAAWGLGLWWRRRQREDPGATLRHRARQEVREAVAALAGHAQAGRAPEFYASLNTALQGQLALTLGGTSGSYTEEVIEGKLVPRGLSPEDAARLRGLFDQLVQARFSPQAASGELSSRAREADAILGALRSLEEST